MGGVRACQGWMHDMGGVRAYQGISIPLPTVSVFVLNILIPKSQTYFNTPSVFCIQLDVLQKYLPRNMKQSADLVNT